jgi:prepilin-type N-terminal cleavage/methylation domain-containing protein
MSLSRLTKLANHLRRDERGFSLMEVLVAMVAGLVVTGALFAILEVSLKQNSRLTDRVESAQVGNATMAKVIDPLRSGCISRQATPVLEGSTPSKLIYTTAFSESTTPAPAQVFKETVEYSATTHKLNALTQAATAGAWPNYSGWETPGKKSVLGENIYVPSGEPGIFRYFKYGTNSSSSTTTSVSALEALTTTGALSEEEAKKVAGVEVGFEALPSNLDTRLNRASTFNDQVTFALASPNSEATIQAAPCE